MREYFAVVLTHWAHGNLLYHPCETKPVHKQNYYGLTIYFFEQCTMLAMKAGHSSSKGLLAEVTHLAINEQ